MAYQEVKTTSYGTRVGNSFRGIGSGILLFIAATVLYIGRVPASPEVGDVRITWEKVVPAKVTIISQVDGDTFKPFTAKNGKTFQTLVMGKKDASEIFESEHSTNKILLWVLRILGVILVIAGLLVWVFAFKGKAQLKKLAAKAAGQPDEQA